MQRARRWCFTIFKEGEEERDWKNIFGGNPINYMIVGEETCPTTQRIHYQGYVRFNNRMYFSKLKRMVPTAHLEIARGTERENKRYCSKEGKIIHEEGECESSNTDEKGGSKVEEKIHKIVENGYKNPMRYVRYRSMLSVYTTHKAGIDVLIADKINEKMIKK